MFESIAALQGSQDSMNVVGVVLAGAAPQAMQGTFHAPRQQHAQRHQQAMQGPALQAGQEVPPQVITGQCCPNCPVVKKQHLPICLDVHAPSLGRRCCQVVSACGTTVCLSNSQLWMLQLQCLSTLAGVTAVFSVLSEQAKHARQQINKAELRDPDSVCLTPDMPTTCTLTCWVVQVRHFAAHYAGDEGLARPFSAMPSDRNLAWSSQPCGLSSPDRPATRLRPDAHIRDQLPATSAAPPQVLLCMCVQCSLGVCTCWMVPYLRCWHRSCKIDCLEPGIAL